MADIVVSVLMENVARLLDFDEEYLLRRVELEVEALQKELVTINSFLKNSEAKRIDNDEVQEVVDRIRDVVPEAEDVVDTYMAEIIELRGRRPLLRKLYHFLFSRGKRLRDAAKKIKSVRNTINLIYSKKDRYGILKEGDIEPPSSPAGTSTWMTVTKAEAEAEAEAEASTSVHLEIDIIEESSDHDDGKALSSEHKGRRWHGTDFPHVVGFDYETKTLVSQLVQGDPRLDVVSITGMGGLGKTTLASKIYYSKRIRNHFECHAWVYVSQNYKTKDYLFGILRCLISSVPEEMHKVSEEELKLTLRAFLREKRYLIVLDDLCTSLVWDEIRDAFPNSFNGSRLLITSNKQLALFASQTPFYSLSSLDEETSWKLFCNKVFPIIKDNPDLKALGKQLVQSCKGVPLVILALGGLLAHKEDKYEIWSKLIDYVNFNYSQNTRPLDVLKLSYNHLPQNLKPCFLHLGVFPMDFEISARYLTSSWIAEGFIQEIGTKTVENVAEDYLEELSARSLIQVTKRRTDGGAKTCHIHDLLRELSISESLGEKFLQVHSESNPASIGKARRVSRVTNKRTGGGDSIIRYIHDLQRQLSIFERISKWLHKLYSEANPAFTSKARRLSIQGNISEYISSYPNVASRAHSLLMFGEGNDFDKKHWRWIFKNFKFLRVLCLEKLFLNSIPKNIEKLIFLRYLRIWSEKVVEIAAIPASICNLKYLEEIDINGHVEECLPKEISTMKQLRIVRFSGGMSIPANPTSANDIVINLQVLSCLLVDEKTKLLMSPPIFPYLRKLHLKYDHGLTQMNEFDVADVFESLCPKGKNVTDSLAPEEKEKKEKDVRESLPQKEKDGTKSLIPDKKGKTEEDVLESLRPKEKDEIESLSPDKKGKKEIEKEEDKLVSLEKLERLKVIDFPTSEPRPNLFPSTLVKVTFLRSYFNSTHFGFLAKLPNLQILKLKGKFPYYGVLGPLRCDAGDFPKLQVFQMIDLEIEIWILKSRAMKKLEHLIISECYQLINVPEELAKLSTLRLVEVSRMSQSFKESLKKLDFRGKCKLLIDSKPCKSHTKK